MADEIKTTTESQNKLNAALRYAGTSAGTLFTVFGVLQFVTPEQVAQLTVAVHDFNQSILSAYGALTKMWVILGPAAVIMLGRAGFKSSSVKGIAAKLLSIAANAADPKATEAQQAIVEATSTIARDPQIQTSTAAKVALLDAVAAQPEVVGSITVTDAKLAEATESPQVKKAA